MKKRMNLATELAVICNLVTQMRFFSFLNKKTKVQQTSSQINNFFFFTLVPVQYALNTLRNEFTFQNYMEAFSLLPLLVI